ncbi:MAG: hypothetical protein DRR19_11130 [Candidatus Parabeggiatoa sp. nov. 1]|nr:MAG: hypothetical protein DRR19_11130 [Gammaproteobacteria bacterium]
MFLSVFFAQKFSCHNIRTKTHLRRAKIKQGFVVHKIRGSIDFFAVYSVNQLYSQHNKKTDYLLPIKIG